MGQFVPFLYSPSFNMLNIINALDSKAQAIPTVNNFFNYFYSPVFNCIILYFKQFASRLLVLCWQDASRGQKAQARKQPACPSSNSHGQPRSFFIGDLTNCLNVFPSRSNLETYGGEISKCVPILALTDLRLFTFPRMNTFNSAMQYIITKFMAKKIARFCARH
jgi:hypothetical protein